MSPPLVVRKPITSLVAIGPLKGRVRQASRCCPLQCRHLVVFSSCKIEDGCYLITTGIHLSRRCSWNSNNAARILVSELENTRSWLLIELYNDQKLLIPSHVLGWSFKFKDCHKYKYPGILPQSHHPSIPFPLIFQSNTSHHFS